MKPTWWLCLLRSEGRRVWWDEAGEFWRLRKRRSLLVGHGNIPSRVRCSLDNHFEDSGFCTSKGPFNWLKPSSNWLLCRKPSVVMDALRLTHRRHPSWGSELPVIETRSICPSTHHNTPLPLVIRQKHFALVVSPLIYQSASTFSFSLNER